MALTFPAGTDHGPVVVACSVGAATVPGAERRQPSMDEHDRRVSCPRCGGEAYLDDDGRRTPVTTAARPCVCDDRELPPHWRP